MKLIALVIALVIAWRLWPFVYDIWFDLTDPNLIHKEEVA